MPLLGRYRAEDTDSMHSQYSITMDVKETDKSYIFCLVEFQSRYGASQMERLFEKSKRIVIRKNRGGHAIRIWNDNHFTFYPFQAGIPFYFIKQ